MTANMHPDQFAAAVINTVKQNSSGICTNPDGTPRDLTTEQAIAANQVLALNGIAAALLAVADAIAKAKVPGQN